MGMIRGSVELVVSTVEGTDLGDPATRSKDLLPSEGELGVTAWRLEVARTVSIEARELDEEDWTVGEGI
jgi:hypothetical protein